MKTKFSIISLIVIAAIMAVVMIGGDGNLPFASGTSNQGVYVPNISASWWRWVSEYIQVQDDSVYSDATHGSIYLGFAPASAAAIHFPVWNKSGGALAVGDACVWDSLKIAVTADTAKLKAARLVNTLTAEGGPCFLIACVSSGTSSNDTLTIYGKDSVGTARTETLPITDAVQYTRSGFLWTDVDSVKDLQSAGGWTTYIVYAEPYLGVTTSGGAVSRFAGLATAATADNDSGYITFGAGGIAWGICDGGSTTIWPGDLLYPAASGDLAPASQTATTTITSTGYATATATGYATAQGDAAFTFDSVSTVDPDAAFPLDSITVYGQVSKDTIDVDSVIVVVSVDSVLSTGTVALTMQFPCAIALEPCFTNNRKIRVAPIR